MTVSAIGLSALYQDCDGFCIAGLRADPPNVPGEMKWRLLGSVAVTLLFKVAPLLYSTSFRPLAVCTGR